MKVLFLTRASLYKVYGGDTIQILSTAKYLRKRGVEVDIKLANEKIDYNGYDLLHVFNIIRPADFLSHLIKAGKPYVISTIYVEYTEYQKKHAKGILALLSNYLNADQIEYLKALARWVKNGEEVNSWKYILWGHRRAIRTIVKNAAYLLPNSESEYRRFSESYQIESDYVVIPNGLDPEVFFKLEEPSITKPDHYSVLCVSRIEGQKNCLNLIKALNHTKFHLKIIGKPAPNHMKYYEACRNIAAANIEFIDFMPQEKLIEYYKQSKVHALPSWNETCGLSSLEAAFFNCNLVITDRGDTKDYFGDAAWYCDPGNPESIYQAVVAASEAPVNNLLHDKIIHNFNWDEAAAQTFKVYESILCKKNLTF